MSYSIGSPLISLVYQAGREKRLSEAIFRLTNDFSFEIDSPLHEMNKHIQLLISRTYENAMLTELRDIGDELEIISLLQDEQLKVIRDMGTIIGQQEDQKLQIKYKRLQDEISDQVVDVANLIKQAGRITTNVSALKC
jgi:hypothetical protein